MFHRKFRGIRPDDLHGRTGLRNPERGFRTEMYFSEIPGEVAGMCSRHWKQLKLDGRSEIPVYQNADVPGVPHLIRGNRLDGVEFRHGQWEDEIDFFAYDGVTVMQSYCFLMKYDDGRDLPEEKLKDIEKFFLRLRRAGVKTLLRFAYELSPTLHGPTAETVLRHWSQTVPLVRKYKDVIYALQCGFVGKFGEWHNSYHKLQQDVSFRKELFDAVLRELPEDRKTMVRYPVLKQQIFGTAPLDPAKAHTMAPEARIGHFNDGFLAHHPSSGGTFGRGDSLTTAEEEFEYVAAESRYLPQDGELFWSDVGNPVLPVNAVSFLAKWHYDTFGFVHGNSLFDTGKFSMDIWKSVPIDPMFMRDHGLSFSEGYFVNEYGEHTWRSYYEYIRDHMGYRIELQEAEAERKDRSFTGKVTLINRGFSAPVNPRPVRMVLLSHGEKAVFTADTDVRTWYGGTFEKEEAAPVILHFSGLLPENFPAGRCTLALELPDGSEILQKDPRYSIRCANDLEFRDGLNILGETDL